jgi:hypothetical protein
MMSTYKRTDGDYNIISIDPSNGDNLNIVTNTVNITGNLDVNGNVQVYGNLTYIDTEDLQVGDPFITVAANNTGTFGNVNVLFKEQGLVTQTSANTFAGLRFDNFTLNWQISRSVYANGAPKDSAYATIASGNTATSPGGANTYVQFNNSSSFGGNVNYRFDQATSKLILDGHQAFGNIATAPSATANSVALYHNAQGQGGTGLYVKSSTVQDELVSRNAAIVLAIIF